MVRYFLTLIIFIVIDSAWLGLVAPKLYKSQIGHLMASNVNWLAALLFYLLYIAALLVFVINPAVTANSWQHALKFGAFLGLAMYATYDLTNLATLKDWPVTITAIDLIWGTFITSATCVLSTIVIQRFHL